MTKLLLSCDDYVYLYKGQYYAARQDSIEFYQRYLRIFDSIRLVVRCVEEEKLNPGRVPLNIEPRIEYFPVPIFHGPKQYTKVYFKVGKALKNVISGCDAAILRIPSTVALRVGKIVKAAGIPYACEVVFDADDGRRGTKGISRLAWKMIDKQMRRLCSKANGVSCVTEFYLQRHYYPRTQNSFVSHYSSLSLPSEFYTGIRQYPNHTPIVIAHTANQIEYNGRKGHIEVIKAVQILTKRGINVKVRFAGKDYYGGIYQLQQLAQSLGITESIEFVGYLSREELDAFLNKADLYVMPTRAEGLPRVIIEAMAKGLPCITTPVSGNPELVGEHFLVPYEKIEMLANRIEELCTNEDLYVETSSQNYKRSCQYESSILQTRRDTFYTKLRDTIR